MVPREESVNWSGGGWGSTDCGAGGCGTTEVISVPVAGSTDAYCDLEAPVCLAPPGLAVLPPAPRVASLAPALSGSQMGEPLLKEKMAAPSAVAAQPQMQLRRAGSVSNGPWNAEPVPQVRRRLSFNTGDWDPTTDYVPRGHTLWEEKFEADWADEDTTDESWGARSETESENLPYFMCEEP